MLDFEDHLETQSWSVVDRMKNQPGVTLLTLDPEASDALASCLLEQELDMASSHTLAVLVVRVQDQT